MCVYAVYSGSAEVLSATRKRRVNRDSGTRGGAIELLESESLSRLLRRRRDLLSLHLNTIQFIPPCSKEKTRLLGSGLVLAISHSHHHHPATTERQRPSWLAAARLYLGKDHQGVESAAIPYRAPASSSPLVVLCYKKAPPTRRLSFLFLSSGFASCCFRTFDPPLSYPRTQACLVPHSLSHHYHHLITTSAYPHRHRLPLPLSLLVRGRRCTATSLNRWSSHPPSSTAIPPSTTTITNTTTTKHLPLHPPQRPPPSHRPTNPSPPSRTLSPIPPLLPHTPTPLPPIPPRATTTAPSTSMSR